VRRLSFCPQPFWLATIEKVITMKKILVLATAAIAVSSQAAFAVFEPVDVPEISAMEGAAAVAVVLAVVAFVWERRRRAA
jgi:hypothetical protein